MAITKWPHWLIIKPPQEKYLQEMKKLLDGLGLHTICESAMCPNIGSCFAEGIATFMILGDVCTRNCGFCGVKHGNPPPPDPKEPQRVAQAAKILKLEHVVVTSVTRDDLPDGGAYLFVETVQQINCLLPKASTELLIPDLRGVTKNLHKVLLAKPTILAHNLETVSRLYSTVRPQANYHRSLSVLKCAKEMSPKILTKSGIMVGLGERREEILKTMNDLREVDCDILTIGQYLQPNAQNIEVKKYIHPKVFEHFKEEGYRIGFKYVTSSPFVRSSFHARQTIQCIKKDFYCRYKHQQKEENLWANSMEK